ncbi:hypothetical protein [Paenibacillus sp. PDC88]|uniref:hypothetical protein n=1 Tax=Paenibacillus sp. PDC88 TaxID=1884375 RepID=UPI00089D9D22|nr:hypothetical protein [Paenibacillus sp. PDC88]SDX45115.1 hypothetical protein SAMN05518848_107232 [Paenibacillus sp. PDC88]
MNRLTKLMLFTVLTGLLAAGCSEPAVVEEAAPKLEKVYYLLDGAGTPQYEEIPEQDQMHMEYSHYNDAGCEVRITAEITNNPDYQVQFVLPDEAEKVFTEPEVNIASSNEETSTYEVRFEVKEEYFTAHPDVQVVYDTAWEQSKDDQKFIIWKTQTSVSSADMN